MEKPPQLSSHSFKPTHDLIRIGGRPGIHARRAGTYPARVATAARATATAASALGTPTARPANVRTSVSRKTTHRIAPFEAKGARPPSIETESRKVGWRRDTSHDSFPEMKLIVDDLLETTRNFPRMG